jgi:hypothetical protein
MPRALSDLARRAFDAIDRVNDGDPARVALDGRMVGAEVVYGRRMSERLASFEPEAPDELAIAVRAQHVGRFRVPRTDYPAGRAGYLAWRRDLSKMHAAIATEILEALGADPAVSARVSDLVRKKGLGRDAGAQALEDVACLVFLEHYFDDFAAKKTDDELVPIVRKTWAKMSDRAHDVALGLSLSDRAKAIVGRALAPQTG